MTSTEHGQTPSQTVGPFFGYALPYEGGPDLVPRGSRRRRSCCTGPCFDGAGEPVPDALIELWQPDADGRPVHAVGSLHRDGSTFTGFGRAEVDENGHYSFTTIRPPRYALVTVFARGLLHHLFTRAYFTGEDGVVEEDAFLSTVDPARRDTLIARADGERSHRFDIRLQGEDETVFIDFGVE